MNKVVFALLACSVSFLFIGCDDAGISPETSLIGTQGPSGGLIFYVDTTDAFLWDYIEAAPSDQSSSIAWQEAEPYVLVYAGGSAVGYGVTNTDDTVGDLGAGTYAARICYDLEITHDGTTYDDWHLPTRNELTVLYENLHARGLGNFADDEYWSSTESATNMARSRNFGAVDDEYARLKVNTFRVRAVRYVTEP